MWNVIQHETREKWKDKNVIVTLYKPLYNVFSHFTCLMFYHVSHVSYFNVKIQCIFTFHVSHVVHYHILCVFFKSTKCQSDFQPFLTLWRTHFVLDIFIFVFTYFVCLFLFACPLISRLEFSTVGFLLNLLHTLNDSIHHKHWIARCHTATHCNNTLQHTATHCNTLQHTAAHCNTHRITQFITNTESRGAVCSSVLQCVAVCCSMLRCVAVWCSE